MSKFIKGQSGNPAGRPRKGLASTEKLREAISNELPDVINVIVDKARDGDLFACKLLLDKCLPNIKPMEQVAPFQIPDGTLSEQLESLLKLVEQGNLTIDRYQKISSSLRSIHNQRQIENFDVFN